MGCALDALPADLRARIGNAPVVVFDGDCVLCTGFFRFVLRYDTAGQFRFATAQSPTGQALYAAFGLDREAFETNLVIDQGRIRTHLGSFAAVMRRLGWPWRVLAIAGWVPDVLGRPLYFLIARNRYRLFGRRDHCMMPDAALQDRFL